MIQKDGKWQVYDVVIEGVSMVKNYRSQFKKLLTNKKPEDLIETLKKKTQQG
jgi:phospholipid transport system substrate-binding protein